MIRPSLRWPRVRVPVVLYAHPLELSLGAALFFTGLRSVYNSATVPNSLQDVTSLVLLWVWQAGTILGSVGMVLGVFFRAAPGKRGQFWRAIERASCYLIASVCGAYCLALIWTGPAAASFAAAALGALALGLVFRAGAIRMTERVINEQAQLLNDDPAVREALRRLIDGRPPLWEQRGRQP